MIAPVKHEHEPGLDWTTKQLAQAGGVSSAYLRQLLIAGELRGRKLGRDWLIPDREAEKWLSNRRAQ
jgi:excisionase family DNA binding protein